MKHILFSLLILVFIAAGACAPAATATSRPVATSLPPATFTLPAPTATLTSTPTAIPSPTPLFTLDLSRFDPDIFPAAVAEHEQPPLIARADETVRLAFWLFDPSFCEQLQRPCRVEPRLYYSYGEEPAFQSAPLLKETAGGLEEWVIRLPAANPSGGSLRYYAEFSLPEAAYTQRYPTAGTLDVFTSAQLIPIELPAAHPVGPGDKVYHLYWGYGHNSVHQFVSDSLREGVPAFDVASDGRIALLNLVDDRVLIYDPRDESYSNFALPFRVMFDRSDLAFDGDDRLVVCDFEGKRAGEILRGLPYCYRFLADGTPDGAAPLYANFPIRLTEGLEVLDRYELKLVAPFDSAGKPNSREVQRQKLTWHLPHRLVLTPDGSLDWRRARFADLDAGLAFEVYCETGVAALDGFEKTPQGYLMLFENGAEQIRAVWIDPAGLVLKDVTLPTTQYAGLPLEATAVAADGSLYVMGSTRNGIEIHVAAGP